MNYHSFLKGDILVKQGDTSLPVAKALDGILKLVISHSHRFQLSIYAFIKGDNDCA
jgi:hypothetical protein